MEKNKPLPLSIVLIARNEAERLPKCLDSVKDWASEVVGVINDCTDETESILKSYGAQVYHHEWTDHTRQKNIALGYATQPWVFLIDADEVVSEELKASIIAFINNPKDFSGAWMSRCTFFMGKWIRHGDWYPDRILRLFKRNKGQFVGGNIHQKGVVEGKTTLLKGDLLHYSFLSQAHLTQKMHVYAEAFLEEQLKKNRKFSPFQAIFRTSWRFFRSYVIKRGFLDGFPGFYIALNQSYYTLVRYSRLLEHELYENK